MQIKVWPRVLSRDSIILQGCYSVAVCVQEQAGEDTADLFIEETELAMHEAQKAKQAIPGMINPHLVVTSME